jgi:thiamine-phosphate diphosphorylase
LSTGRHLTDITRRFLALAAPPEAAIIVNGHPEIAQGTGAQGVQLAAGDLGPADARRVFARGWIGCSVHNEEEAESAARAGADYLVAGSVYPTDTHPGQPSCGPGMIRRFGTLGLPVIAIGGVRLDRIQELRDAGAYGIAGISALWDAPDPAAAALALLEAWSGEP